MPSDGADAPDPITTEIQGLLAAVNKQLDPGSAGSGAIASGTLQVTTASGLGAFATAAAGAATAIIGAAKGSSDSIVIAALGFAAVALLAIVFIVRSDHQARSSVYVALDSSLPALITAATASARASTAGAVTAGPSSYVIPVHDEVRVKLATTGEELFDVLALRIDIDPANPWGQSTTPAPWYLTGQIGGSPPAWRQGDIGSLAARPPTSGA